MSEYSYYLKISVKDSAVSANETNFPVALVMTDSALATVANGGNIANVDNSGGASGSLTVPADFEVRTDPHDSSTALDFEVVDYTASTGYIEFWIELDSLSSSSGADIYICFGNPRVTTSQEDVAGTWGNGFEGVYHLSESSGTICDSVGSYDGTAYGNLPNSATGQIGSCQTLDGTGDAIDCGDVEMDTWTELTVAAWGKTSTTNTSMRLVSKDEVGVAGAWILRWNEAGVDSRWMWTVRDDNADDWGAAEWTSTDANDGNWHQWVSVLDGPEQDLYLYVDANEKDKTADWSDAASTIEDDDNEEIVIGADSDVGSFGQEWDGEIDEVRISSTARDSDWISTAYENQNAPSPDGTFWTALGSKTRMRRGPIGVAPLLMA